MPCYDYECTKCKTVTPQIVKIDDRHTTKIPCETCGKILKFMISAPTQFFFKDKKGTTVKEFYKTMCN